MSGKDSNPPAEVKAEAWPTDLNQPTVRQRLKQRAERGAVLQHQAPQAQADAAALRRTHPAAAEQVLHEAKCCEAEAASLLTPPEPLRRGAGGELELSDGLKEIYPGLATKVTAEPDALAAEASLERLELLQKTGCVAPGLEAAGEAEGPVEQMLSHQLAMTHRLAMLFGGKAVEQLSQVASWQEQPRQQVHSIEAARLAKTSTRLMEAYQKGVLVLDRHRHGGKQEIIVQHVHVDAGGQAVVAGSVKPGARRGGG